MAESTEISCSSSSTRDAAANTEHIAQEDISDRDGSTLTSTQRAQVERNRQRALLLRKARLIPHPYAKINTADSVEKSIIRVAGSKFIDTGGGFLLEQKDVEDQPQLKRVELPAPILEPNQPQCLECQEDFGDSFLFRSFDFRVCDKCRDDQDKHSLITRTDAKSEYLLKDCDLDKREPKLKFLLRKNPHNVNWGDMKLYLHVQVEERALEVWGGEEEILEERERREGMREKSKAKKYNKQMKALRMSVRSSLYDRTSAASHTHTFGPDTYHEEDDNYTHVCTECDYEETFEKM